MRKSAKYSKWRKKVYARDKYTRRKCKIKQSLNAHHIDGWALYPKGRYWVSNGITLCARCHYLYHENFMGGSKHSSKRKDFTKFMKTFDILLAHKINPIIFRGYIGL